jgi:hypothetical protein
MRKNHRFVVGAVCAVVLSAGAGTQAASLVIDDSVPGELTISWTDFDYGARVFSPTVSSTTATSSWTVAGETASFWGDWATGGALTGQGVIYFVDPFDHDRVRARIDATWTNQFSDTQFNPLVITSSPLGSDLGPLPAAFKGLGIPMPVGSRFLLEYAFRDPVTAELITDLENMEIEYFGDFVLECPHPALVSFPLTSESGAFSDIDPSGPDYEQAELIEFSQDVVVRSIRWWGWYSLSTQWLDSVDDFEVRVYEDAGGVPDLSSLVVFHPTDVAKWGAWSPLGNRRFAYATLLRSPMTLKANTPYWLAIVNNTVGLEDQWAWAGTDAGDNLRAYRAVPNVGTWGVTTSVDLAYELCGNAMSLDCPTDYNGDTLTDGGDLAVLLANWGACGPPLPLVVPTEPSHRIEMLTNPSDDSGAVNGANR